MPLYAVLFEDNEAAADKRQHHMADHLAFLERNQPAILSAGPMTDAVSGRPAGGLWLVQEADAEAVRALVEEDPFWPTGLRKSVRILQWTQVFEDGKRRI